MGVPSQPDADAQGALRTDPEGYERMGAMPASRLATSISSMDGQNVRMSSDRLRWASRSWLYAAVVVVAAITCMLLVGFKPSLDSGYALIGLAAIVGALLLIRARPGKPGASLVGVAAVSLGARFGGAAVPALGYAAVVANVVRQAPLSAVIILGGHDLLAATFALACASVVGTGMVGTGIVFAVTFAVVRVLLWHVGARVQAFDPTDVRLERPSLILSLLLAPIGAIPLAAADRFGDGGLVFTLDALLALLFVVREGANLATARAEAEQERRKLEELHAFQDDLVHLLTHDMKTPVTTMVVRAQLARKAVQAGQVNDRLLENLRYVEEAARSVSRLVDNLLELATAQDSAEMPPAEEVDVEELVDEVVSDLAAAAEQKGIRLVRDVPEPAPILLAPPSVLRDILGNLVSNAVKYTQQGGQVAIVARRGAKSGWVDVRVEDTGIGMSPEDVSHLFTRFFRSRDPRARAEQGTGLGLALTKAMVDRIGGEISVESEINRGTTFVLDLPAFVP